MGVTLCMAEVSCPLAAGGRRGAEHREACVSFRDHVDALGHVAAASQTKAECAEHMGRTKVDFIWRPSGWRRPTADLPWPNSLPPPRHLVMSPDTTPPAPLTDRVAFSCLTPTRSSSRWGKAHLVQLANRAVSTSAYRPSTRSGWIEVKTPEWKAARPLSREAFRKTDKSQTSRRAVRAALIYNLFSTIYLTYSRLAMPTAPLFIVHRSKKGIHRSA